MDDHKREYTRLIESAKTRRIETGTYTEKHHIVPVSLGGSNDSDNLVELTAAEHFQAHYLLWKIYKNREMTLAFKLMCTVERDGIKYTIDEDEYQQLKEDNRKFRSEFMSGRPGNNLGKTLSEDWKNNISKSLIGNKSAIGNTNFKGKTHTEEAKEAISKKRKGVPTRTGIPFTQEVKDKMSADRKGKPKQPWSEERKAARRELLAKKFSQEKSPD